MNRSFWRIRFFLDKILPQKTELRAMFALSLLAAGCSPAVAQEILVTSLPPYGSADYLQGRVSGVIPSNYALTILINIPGLGAYTKPYCDATFTQAQLVQINSDGTWSTPIVTGGVDETATQIGIFLVPANTAVPCYFQVDGMPSALESMATTYALIRRPPPTQVTFAGQVWDVKTNTVPLGPGPCLYSDSNSNVWVDGQGQLHLKITNQNGQWYCAEVISRSILGYGNFTFSVNSTVANLDPNIVLGSARRGRGGRACA
jgi:hypothetical protein